MKASKEPKQKSITNNENNINNLTMRRNSSNTSNTNNNKNKQEGNEFSNESNENFRKIKEESIHKSVYAEQPSTSSFFKNFFLKSHDEKKKPEMLKRNLSYFNESVSLLSDENKYKDSDVDKKKNDFLSSVNFDVNAIEDINDTELENKKIILELFPDIENADDSVVNLLSPTLKKEFFKLKNDSFNNKKEISPLKKHGIHRYFEENFTNHNLHSKDKLCTNKSNILNRNQIKSIVTNDDSIFESKNVKNITHYNKNIEDNNTYCGKRKYYNETSESEIDNENGAKNDFCSKKLENLRTSHNENEITKLEEDMIICTECDSKVWAFDMVEHMDYHMAVKLRKEQQISRISPLKSNTKRKKSQIKNTVSKITKLDNFFVTNKK